jgi:hypothetical protein
MGFIKNVTKYLKQEKKDGYMVVTFYSTDICKINENSFVLNSGGYETQSTARALNLIALEYNLPFMAKCQKGNMMIYAQGKTVRLAENKEYEFSR